MKFTALTLAVAAVYVQAQTSAPTVSPTVTVTSNPTPAPAAPTDVCDVNDQVVFANNPIAVPCGAGYSTNCENYEAGSFCSLTANNDRVCCKSTATVAKTVSSLNSCSSCLNNSTLGYSWDGSDCFGGVASTNVLPTETIVTTLSDCPVNDCLNLQFVGTCWKRCGTRGWGIDEAAYYLMQASTTPYNPYYGVQQINVLPAGEVPSAFGVACPDPSILAQAPSFSSMPIIYNPFVAPNIPVQQQVVQQPVYYNYAPVSNQVIYGASTSSNPYSTIYGTTPTYNSGGVLPTSLSANTGLAGYTLINGQYYSTSGRQSLTGSSSSVYSTSPMSTTYTQPLASNTVSQLSSATIAAVSATTSAVGSPRCDPAGQCSCDQNCCTRGDCCEDFQSSGCGLFK